MNTCKCFSCGGEYPDIEGPIHRYMTSSSGCWSVYGEVLAREYSNPDYFEVHRLTVDAYAVQHPGSTDRQSVQSVGVHLVRLCLFLEHGLTAENANNAMLEAGKYKHNFTWLEPPENMGRITAADVIKAKNVAEHKSIVREWAQSSWEAWSKHHNTIWAWLPAQQSAQGATAKRSV
ncbi:MAG: DUF5946 family protein [Gammaproteobacteria bacterium]|nr:DUF5946 family protein [Gammaproteobacteria bacterium]